MTIMEPTAKFPRFISCTAIVFLLAALTGCTQEPASQSPKAEKPKTDVAAHAAEKSDAAPAHSTDRTTPPTAAGPQTQTEPSKPESIAQPDETPPSIPNVGEDQNAVDDKKTTPDQSEKAVDDKKTPAQQGEKSADNDKKEPAKQMTDEEIAAELAKQREAALRAIAEKLGQPLIDNLEKLTKPHPAYPVWIDKENKKVVLVGAVCQTNAPLEMFAVPSGTKEHEAILAIPTEAFIVHASLLAIGAKPGKPAEFGPGPNDYEPATGQPIDITVKWKNDKGEVQSARAQEWIKNAKTGKGMEHSWVFCGSGFWKDDQTGIEYYKAEGGDFICVSNFPSAMLDLPVESSQKNDELAFQANADRVPPLGTPVTLILTPKSAEKSETKAGLPDGAQSLNVMVPPDQRITEPEEGKLGVEPSEAKK
jgi:hypothetical protein